MKFIVKACFVSALLLLNCVVQAVSNSAHNSVKRLIEASQKKTNVNKNPNLSAFEAFRFKKREASKKNLNKGKLGKALNNQANPIIQKENEIQDFIFEFSKGLLKLLPIVEDYRTNIQEYLEFSPKCNRQHLIGSFNIGKDARKHPSILEKLNNEVEMEAYINSLPGRNLGQEKKIEGLEVADLKRACELIVQEKSRELSDVNYFAKNYQDALDAARQIKEKNISFRRFVKHLPSPRISFYLQDGEFEKKCFNLKRYLKKRFFHIWNVKSIEELKGKLIREELNWNSIIDTTIADLSLQGQKEKCN